MSYTVYAGVVPAEKRLEAGSKIALLTQNPGDTETFSVALSPTGGLPATHFGCQGLVPEGYVLQLQELMVDVEGNYFTIAPGITFDSVIGSIGLNRVTIL
jgi:hypothetical protein